jgi:hypothetical protein
MNKKYLTSLFLFIFILFILPIAKASEIPETTNCPDCYEIKYDLNLLFNISNISYKTNTNWFDARKIENPNSFIIDYKNYNKAIRINLSNFDIEKTVYALIITNSNGLDEKLENLLKTKDFNNSNYPLQTNYKISTFSNNENIDKISFKLNSQKTVIFDIDRYLKTNKIVLIFMQQSTENKINLTYTNLYILDNKTQSIYQLCEINRRIVGFYCKGYNCKLPTSCLDRWDFNVSKFIKEEPVKGTLNKNIIPQQIVNKTISYLDTVYNWAGRNGYSVEGIGTLNSGLDCVGLQYVVLRDLGYIDNSASCLAMFSDGCAVADLIENNKGHITGTVEIIKNKSELDLLKPGDLLFLNTKSGGLFGHAGIYISTENGIHKYIDAAGSKSNPDKVRYDNFEEKLKSGALKFPFYYARILEVNKSNINCSRNYVTTTSWKGSCCAQTAYC